jgi:hypothetical protein
MHRDLLHPGLSSVAAARLVALINLTLRAINSDDACKSQVETDVKTYPHSSHNPEMS